MAKMIPYLTQEELELVESRAEQIFYQACKDQLSDNWTVMHSVEWISRNNKMGPIDGECDFIIFGKNKGLFVIEIKGGGIGYNPNEDKWFSIDRNGDSHEINNPFEQAKKGKFSIMNYLNNQIEWTKPLRGRKTLIRHAVFFSDIEDNSSLQAPERPKEIIGTHKNLLSLEKWLNSLLHFWKGLFCKFLVKTTKFFDRSILSRQMLSQPNNQISTT